MTSSRAHLLARVITVVALIVMLAVSVIFGTSPTGVTHDDDPVPIRAELDGEPVRIDLPIQKPLRGVAIWFHGQGGDEDTRMGGEWLNALRRDGWAVASSRFHGSSWGSPASVSDTKNLVNWISALTGMEPSLWVAGSMGGAISLNTMIQAGLTPRCWYGTKPVVDLTSVANVPDAITQLGSVWGGRGRAPSEWNPAEMISRLPTSTVYRVLASPEDAWVPADSNGRRLITKLSQVGVSASYRPVTGWHGDDSHIDIGDLRAFAASC